jgi:agmatinase
MPAFAVISPPRTFLDQPFLPIGAVGEGHVAILAAAHGTPYPPDPVIGYTLDTGSAGMPASLRAAANESSSNIDHYDFDLGGPLLGDGGRRIADCGDLDLSESDGAANRAAIEAATAILLKRKAVPFLIGGDDSVPIPFLAAFGSVKDAPPVDILQIDAHIDWRENIGGERMGYSSTMRRASEHGFVRSITQIGMRGVGSARPAEVEAAQAWGARLFTMREARARGAGAIAGLIPKDGRLVIQLDCDALDPSVCPAVNAATPGGFQFEELADIIRACIGARGLAGFSIVELAPEKDIAGISALAAARLVCNAIGAYARSGGTFA